MALLRDKRFILVGLLMAVVAAYFWGGSRYPALNEKLMMGTNTPFSDLAFSTLIKIPPDTTLLPRMAYASINWAYTNRQGMTFGVLFAALVMTMLALIQRRTFRSRVANAAMGLVFGTPLGVCVNCAAPIGKAIHAAGGSVETSLATMVSSPTLNVIVLTMLFALFPTFMAVIKIALTIGFILIVIPVLTRLLPATAPIDGSFDSAVAAQAQRFGWIGPAMSASPGEARTWREAASWVTRSFGRNLWFVIKTTVPLMLLAGVLGSILVTLVPLDSLADLLPASGPRTVVAMVGLAALGVFLPVPMSFDVIVTAVLWQAGLPIQYAMVLLFTLGVFSVFSFFIVWQSMSPRMAAGLYAGVAALGIVAGLVGQQYFAWDTRRQQQVVFDVFSHSSASAQSPRVLRVGGETRDLEADGQIVPTLMRSALLPERWPVADDRLTIARLPFSPPADSAAAPADPPPLFTRTDGRQIGLDEPYAFSVLKFEGPFVQFRGVASGDVHNDGWVDLLFASDAGLSLYANRHGQFVEQTIDIPALKDFYVANAALVDLNNDGWLDIVFSTYRHGTYVIYNREGRFTAESLQQLPTQLETVVTGAMAFGDLDRDGRLDIVMGNWLPPCRSWLWCDPRPFNDYVLHNDNGTFVPQPLEGISGRQTLSLLLSDFNNDGILDLVVGNEDLAPDAFLLGKGDGAFRPLTKDDGIIPYSGQSTMSVSSADIDNSLRPSIYVGQIGGFGQDKSKSRPAEQICDEITDPEQHKACAEVMRIHLRMPSQVRKRDVYRCLSPEMGDYREDCVAYSLLLWARGTGPEAVCDMFPDRWDAFRYNCHVAYNEKRATGSARPQPDAESIPAVGDHNILLTPNDDGRFTDRAVNMGVQNAGFTWNAKFADLDNDEFVDLYAVNGWFPETGRQSHVFYLNQGGKQFVDRTVESGLTSFLPTGAYTYVDLDNDGDLDIVAVPGVGPILVYRNNSTRNRIAFELRDHIGNRSGIGSRIIIHYGPGGSRHQMREIQASGGFTSFDAPIAYFGLGEFAGVERVEVQWSTGERSDIHGDFSAGARYVIDRPARGMVADGDAPPQAVAAVSR
jgi:uncharacterized membrane protein YraQ (UPF0718 family)